MVRLSQYASNQIQSIINEYCGYRTRGENGRSAFWLWYDQVKNYIRGITVSSSKRLSNGVYKYTMRYLGDVFFVYSRTREKGRFSGVIITVLDFDFDETNFFNWLQHQPLENRLPPKPNTINKRFKPRPLGFGYTMVKSISGLYTIADSDGKPLNSNDWFKSILKMRKTAKGEIATFVNKNGFAYAYYPQREKHLEATNMSWSRVSVNESKIIRLNESNLRIMIRECVKRVLEETLNKKTVGEYTAIDGSWWDGFPCGLEEMGAVQDVRMYDRLHTDGQLDTIALFRRCDNKQYFYAKIVPIDGSKETKWVPIPLNKVPELIRQDIHTINPLGHEPYLLT